MFLEKDYFFIIFFNVMIDVFLGIDFICWKNILYEFRIEVYINIKYYIVSLIGVISKFIV